MNASFNQTRAIIMLVSASLGINPVAQAAANFSEGFDNVGPTNGAGPQNLINQGWIFRNQSQPAGMTVWRQGRNYSFPDFTPQSGDGYLTNWASWDDGNRNVSAWALLPALPGQSAGDVISCYAAGAVTPNSRIQLRYSPSGGTSTGSSYTDVGDFTQVLAEIVGPPAPNIGDWAQLLGDVPGSGRLAIRWYEPPLPSLVSPFIGLDTLVVGPPPCNAPPLPGSGQTVTWTAANSPYGICGNATIPVGATVNVEPGVTVHFEPGFSLTVAGALHGVGTTASPIAFTATTNFPPILFVDGTLDLTYVQVGGQIRPDGGATLLLDHCTLAGPGAMFKDISPAIGYVPPYIQVTNCAFNGSALDVSQCTLVVRNTSFSGTYFRSIDSYVLFNGMTMANSPGDCLMLFHDAQPVWLDNLSITGAAGAGLALSGDNRGNNYLIGPNTVLQNNLYPVSVGNAGLLPGSVIPATGNVHNYIPWTAGAQVDSRGPVIWAPVAVPYAIESDFPHVVGLMTILPGVDVKIGADVGFVVDAGTLVARGLPGLPITFERLNPAQPWAFIGIQTFGDRVEHCLLDGSNYGLSAAGSLLNVESCTFRNNYIASQANGFGALVVHGTQFTNNNTGILQLDASISLNGHTNPNAFAGNTLAVDIASPFGSLNVDARENWWNSPSGPQAPDNPGGTGDPVGGLADAVHTVPFRTAPPNFNDAPPVVLLQRHSDLAEPGHKIIVTWDAQDDAAIVEQRILFSPALDLSFPVTVADHLPPGQRSFEWTVPDIGFQVSGVLAYLRVVAVDNIGQEGWDEAALTIPTTDLAGTPTITTNFSGTYQAGQSTQLLCYDIQGYDGFFSQVDIFLFLDGDESYVGLGGTSLPSACLPLPVVMPFVSTDLARIGLRMDGNCCNRFKWVFGNYFTVRPDPRIGDAPPSVHMLSPQAGQTFAGGSVVPITWTASDDEGVRSFTIQASYDQGRVWHNLVTDLPAAATSFDWQLPASTGIADVRVRVIVRDLRFQSSSDGGDRSFAILPGAVRRGDLNCDDVVNFDDINPFVLALSDPAAYAAAYPNCNILSGDCNNDGFVNFDDINAFVALLSNP